MPHSHHSHSGSYCNHATDTLSLIVSTASEKGFTTYSLTEHCPRSDEFLYPGEKESGWTSEHQWGIFDSFVNEATELRAAHASAAAAAEGRGRGLQVLVGFEAEWLTPHESIGVATTLMQRYAGKMDYFVGSVHHVDTVPIDYDQTLRDEAREKCGGEVELCERYFDLQSEMLMALRPRVVGHFDLVRLMSDGLADSAGGWEAVGEGSVWGKILRNLECVVGYGGVLEINTSAWRKGLDQPYPREEIVRAFNKMGGLVVLSDDCHAISHVGTNYGRLLPFIKQCGLQRIAYLDKEDTEGDVVVKTMSIEELEKHPYWRNMPNYICLPVRSIYSMRETESASDACDMQKKWRFCRWNRGSVFDLDQTRTYSGRGSSVAMPTLEARPVRSFVSGMPT